MEPIMKVGSKLAILVFSIVALAHFLRMLLSIDVYIDAWSMPQWMSVPGVIVPGLIAFLLWRETGK